MEKERKGNKRMRMKPTLNVKIVWMLIVSAIKIKKSALPDITFLNAYMCYICKYA